VNGDFGKAARDDVDGQPETSLGEGTLSSQFGDAPTLSPEQQRDAGAAYLAAREFKEWAELHPLPVTPAPWINCSTPWRKLVVVVVVFLAALSAFGIAAKAILLLDPPIRCSDFSTEQEAQAYFDNSGPNDGPPPSGARTGLDVDGDGMACETLP
jgi:hypothetical protein